MRVILVDDELPLLEDLRDLLKAYEGIEIVGIYTDPHRCIEELPFTKPECAFLDIEMSGMNGIELAERLIAQISRMEILFITAYNHYATQAFEVDAIDYLLKPIRPERLARAVEKLTNKKPIVSPLPTVTKIYCFGHFEIFVGGRAIKWKRSKARELLAYLFQNEGKWIAKYRICEDIWCDCDPEHAISNLQTAVWAVRKTLREHGCEKLTIEFAQDRYILHADVPEWDKRLFDQYYKSCRAGQKDAVSKCLMLYRGDYLHDEDWPWADLQRERYAIKYLELKKTSR